MVRNNEKSKPETVTAEEFRAALEIIRAGKAQDEPAALAAERERLKLERERVALERERARLRRAEEPPQRSTLDPGGIVAAIISAIGAIIAIAGVAAMI